jgi:hypothetical protein
VGICLPAIALATHACNIICQGNVLCLKTCVRVQIGALTLICGTSLTCTAATYAICASSCCPDLGY